MLAASPVFGAPVVLSKAKTAIFCEAMFLNILCPYYWKLQVKDLTGVTPRSVIVSISIIGPAPFALTLELKKGLISPAENQTYPGGVKVSLTPRFATEVGVTRIERGPPTLQSITESRAASARE